jgi:tripartite-type tricarboxylate transporter receptor subunit TctC
MLVIRSRKDGFCSVLVCAARSISAAVLVSCAGTFASEVSAQTYPSKPITIMLSYGAGGPTDFLARMLAERVSQRVGQPVLVNPKPGANERIATEYLRNQPADGYLIQLVAVPHATNPAIFDSLPYDSVKDFTALIHLVDISPILSVRADSPVRNFADYVNLARTRPGEANFGSAGNATSTHLTMELLSGMAGVSFLHIPYKGDAAAVTEVLGGRLVASMNAAPAVVSQIKAGRLRGIGISSMERSPVVPDVPTFVEQGYPGAVAGTWFGLIVRSGTPRQIIARLNSEFNAALAIPEVREKLVAAAMTPVGGAPEQFAATIRRDTERWGNIIKERRIKIE